VGTGSQKFMTVFEDDDRPRRRVERSPTIILLSLIVFAVFVVTLGHGVRF
jgi:hypothetical protein